MEFVLEREAYELIAALPGIDFVGNVEGTDLSRANANVIVCDGYTGNIMLKTAEGTARLMFKLILEAVAAPEYAEAVEALAPVMIELRERLNPERAGGAHLLGVKGVVIITHGSSTRLSISTAVATATAAVEAGLPDLIAAGLAESAGLS